MATRGAARDAKQPTQNLSIEIPTDAYIALGEMLDPTGFSLIKQDTQVKRAKGTDTIWPLHCDSSAIEEWIVETVVKETEKARQAYEAELEAMKAKVRDSLKEELRAEILAELEAKKTKKGK